MSSPPPATTTPGSNVTPMWGGTWPGRPPAVPPNCFSQLYGLNQCYDDIIMMKQILAKVICDMAANDPAFQKCLAEGIAASGSSVPLIGVTNGSNAQPGQVGEFIQIASPTINIPTSPTSQTISMGVLQPGDWDCWAFTTQLSDVHDIGIELSPQPVGFSNGMLAFIGSLGEIVTLVTPTAQASIAVPTLIVFSVASNQAAAGPGATTTAIVFNARRAR